MSPRRSAKRDVVIAYGHNVRFSTWAGHIPNEAWISFVDGFARSEYDGVAIDSVVDLATLRRVKPFAKVRTRVLGAANGFRYACRDDGSFDRRVVPDLPVFSLTRDVASRLRRLEHYGQFGFTQPEICLFGCVRFLAGGDVRAALRLVSPILWIRGMTNDEIRLLLRRAPAVRDLVCDVRSRRRIRIDRAGRLRLAESADWEPKVEPIDPASVHRIDGFRRRR